MFKTFIAVLFACLPVIAIAKDKAPQPEQLDKETLSLIYKLAERPVGVVVGDRCEVRGAIWANGPYPNAKQSLINVQTGETFRATTNAMGVYSMSIPYPGTPVVLAERIDAEVFVRKEFAETAKVLNGGVVCDHRLKTEVAHNPKLNKETK